MAVPGSYVVCDTPRTGSTLLCALLTSTRVLGPPASYFRGQDEAHWAAQFGLTVEHGRVHDYRAFVAKARAAGSTANGVSAARIMWGSLDRLIDELGAANGGGDRAALERGFGPLAFIHLRRENVLDQACHGSEPNRRGSGSTETSRWALRDWIWTT